MALSAAGQSPVGCIASIEDNHLMAFFMAFFSTMPAFKTPGFWHKLTNQLAVILALCTILPVLMVGVYSVRAFSGTLSDITVDRLSLQVTDEAAQISEFLTEIERDTLFLSYVPTLNQLIAARDRVAATPTPDTPAESPAPTTEVAALAGRLRDLFAAQMAAKPDYMQVRYLDETGNEIVRVDSDGTIVTPIASDQLQNKGDRDYFTETMGLAAGELYVSPLNLNRERGEIERPFKPVIRYATPVFNAAGTPRGMVVINAFTRRLIEEFEIAGLGASTELFVLDREGYYIYHADVEKRWGFDLGTDERFSNDYPEAVARAVLSSATERLTESQDSLFSYTTLVLGNQNQAPHLTFVAMVPRRIVFASVRQFQVVTAGIVLLAIAIALTFGILRMRQIVVLVRRLSLAIAEFSLALADTLAQQERIAGDQSNSVSAMTVALSEVQSGAQQNAGQAEIVTDECQAVFSLSESGNVKLQATLQGMQSLQQQVDFIAEQSQHLGSQTENIGNITNLAAVVSDLASQTNMLALNAAVEAVRAGERGRGFGVVATEIRKLADQSRATAAQIAAVVPEIQTAIAATLQATRAGTETVQASLSSVEAAALAFEQVRTTADTMLSSSQEISQTVEQQAQTVRAVAEAMQAVDRGAQQANTGIRETRQGIEALRERARQLQALV